MLGQEIFGLLQGCTLGRIRYPTGLTTDGPDYNKLLCHLSFPEPIQRPFGSRNDIRTGIFGRLLASSSSVLPVASGNSRDKSRRPHTGSYEARLAQKKAVCGPIHGRLCGFGRLNSESSQRSGMCSPRSDACSPHVGWLRTLSWNGRTQQIPHPFRRP